MSVKSLFSDQWYRVAEVKPRLKRHAGIHRHVYRGQVWYVLQDQLTGKHHRFSPTAYLLMSHMNGHNTMQTIWEEAVAKLGQDAPTQDQTVQLLGQLHAADVLASDVPPDILEVFQRYQQQKKQKWIQRMMSPMAIKVPLFDPDKFLARYVKWVGPLFSLPGLMIWLSIAMWALVSAGLHWAELTENISDTVLNPQNLIMMALLFPLIKGLHELGHGFAAKSWGGEVHEIGIMFLVFMPVPYIDASSASAFREGHKRMIVGAAGMMVEILIAAMALLIWQMAEPGVYKSLAYNVMLIAGVSTLLFNANPLLRFDGYYMLADLLQIPNLFARANKYITFLLQKHVLRLSSVQSPVTAQGEAFWFVFYSITSFIYRTFLVIAIALFVASKFFVIGVLLATWSLGSMFLLPLFKGIKFLLLDPKVQPKRLRSMFVSSGLIGGLAAFLILFPMPHWTNVEGVVWLPEKSLVRAGVSCFVEELLIDSGSKLEPGESIFRCEDPLLRNEIRVIGARLQEAEVTYISALIEGPVKAEIQRKNLNTIRAELRRAQEKLDDLVIKSKIGGQLRVPLAQDLPGQFLKKGQVIAYIVQDQPMTVRAVVTQKDVAQVRNATRSIELRRTSKVEEILAGEIKREVPGASEQLPSPALGTQGGGAIAVDPRQRDGLATFQKVFQFDIHVLDDLNPSVFEERVYVRFYHDREPLMRRWVREVRLTLQEEFGV